MTAQCLSALFHQQPSCHAATSTPSSWNTNLFATIACQYSAGAQWTVRQRTVVPSPCKCRHPMFAFPLFKSARPSKRKQPNDKSFGVFSGHPGPKKARISLTPKPVRERKVPININKFGGLSRAWVGAGLGGRQKICVCVLFGSFLMGRKAHKQNPQKIPGYSRENVVYVYFS